MDEVVERILQKMKEKGLDQKTLAKEIGIRHQAITEWKMGVTASYTKYLPQLANVLGTSVEFLVTGETEPSFLQLVLTPKEEELMSKFRALSEKGQEAVLRILEVASDMQ